ncbi:antibiotic biosynthesis monooxygenase [Paracoccus sp. YIM 132242]|uniref:Antibiotic biosynthesis monooxygenase n=1 Tax=Paracoccus lichenicola TaxID=2665644 RepID=A0A6L6HVM7_9RHOB|nr:putative quinol monooxygenase [Paracoccus lichenicola]MTE02213.1 antibiotic biosynthesis monooxygenase [Paracoccus lichenicola]
MDKFIITLQLLPGTRDAILARAPEVQAATRAEPGCIGYDFYTCTDDPDRLVFVESWRDKAAHDFHMAQEHTKAFIAFHEPKHVSISFETINPADQDRDNKTRH